MGWSLFGKKTQAVNPVREVLFGDVPMAQWPPKDDAGAAFPWDAFVSARAHVAAGQVAPAVACWQKVIATAGLESRHYLQAWHFLRAHGVQPPAESARNVLGIVVEYAMPQGLDLLTAYADRTARYYNHSGSGVVWEHPNTALDECIDKFLGWGSQIVSHTAPWDKERLPAPAAGHVRFSFLTPSGIHLGQGRQDVFAADPQGAVLLKGATLLMQILIAQSKASQRV
jgi:hypothetical protein